MASEETTQRREVLGAPLSVQMKASERGLVRRAAFLSDESVSAFVRSAAVKAATRLLAREQKKAA